MEKELNSEVLNALKEKYDADPTAKAVRRALYKTDVLDLAYVQENENSVQHNFDINIETMKATSQGNSGRCWIFAGANFLREEVAKKCNIKDFEISQNYISFWDKLEKINWTMESIISLKDVDWDDRTLMWVLQNGINDGGQWDMFAGIIKKYGVVPKSAFPESYASGHTRSWASLVNRSGKRAYGGVTNMLLEDKKTGAPKVAADGSHKAKTSHTLNPVPCFIYDNFTANAYEVVPGEYGLSDVAATSVNLLGYEAPEMWDPSMIKIKN